MYNKWYKKRTCAKNSKLLIQIMSSKYLLLILLAQKSFESLFIDFHVLHYNRGNESLIVYVKENFKSQEESSVTCTRRKFLCIGLLNILMYAYMNAFKREISWKLVIFNEKLLDCYKVFDAHCTNKQNHLKIIHLLLV